MKKNLLKHLMPLTLLVNVFFIYGQSNDPILISENKEIFVNSIINQKSNAPTRIEISKNQSLDLKLNLKHQKGNNLSLIGIVNNDRLSTFSLEKTNNQLTGELILNGSKKAYKFSTDNQGKVFLTETDIHDVLCVDFESVDVDEKKATGTPLKMNLQLESLPGAEGIIYLDFDGEVVTGTRWVGGDTINAEAANFTEQQITDIWKLMAEDFRPFNLNVTTRRDLFDASPINRRMMVIFTPTKDASPDAGGVAYLRSFASNTFDDPCWVYNIRSVRAAGETGSHEVGHTLGLSHDGQGGTEYYRGHGTWSPIMGWSVNRQIGHWSLGEYEDATQDQDDIAIMADNRNGVGFRNDDHADIITEATLIQVGTDGTVSSDQNFGFIGQRTDKDVFSFVMETGDVSFNFEPDPDYPNLNIQARILNALGEQVAFSDPSGLSASISTNLPGGTYFIEIDGVGEGNTFEGYSDYSSLGSYYITGNYIPGDNNQPPVANFEGTKMGCSLVEFKNLSINKVNSYLWDFGDGNTSDEQNPSHTYETAGNYTVTLTVTNDVGANTNEKNNFVEINIPDLPTGDDLNICPGESVTLSVSGNSDFTWYSEATGGIALGFGAEFNTPELDATQTYYVGGSIGQCNTETRTEIRAVVVPLPESPTITVNDAQRLSVPAEYTSYQWYLDGEAQESSDQAEYLPQQVGEYTVEVFNEAGCSVVSAAFAVDRSQLNLSLDNREFSFFPNPLKSDQLFNIEGITANDFDLRIVDVLGQIVYQSEPNAILDLNDLTSGLYFILINNESIGKFIKQ